MRPYNRYPEGSDEKYDGNGTNDDDGPKPDAGNDETDE